MSFYNNASAKQNMLNTNNAYQVRKLLSNGKKATETALTYMELSSQLYNAELQARVPKPHLKIQEDPRHSPIMSYKRSLTIYLLWQI